MAVIEIRDQIARSQQNLGTYALKLTHNKEDAKDLLQETMMKAVSNTDKFMLNSNLQGWLHTIMRNTFISNYNRAKRRKTKVESNENLLRSPTTQTVSNQAISGLNMEEIQTAIDELSDRYRQAFLMHYEGFKYHEIAEKMAVPIGTVKNRIHVARKALKSKLYYMEKR